MKTQYVSKDDANKIRCARGFSSFKKWAKENREGIRVNKKHGREELVKILENEYDTLIAPNL